MVTGSDNPLIVNAELLVLAAVIFTLAPLAVRLPEPSPLVPTTTLPMARVAGLSARVPAPEAPVPDKGIVRVGFVAVEVTVTSPLALPAAVGANSTEKVAVPPPGSTTGAVMPLKLNPVPLIATFEIVMVVLPVLVTVSEMDWLLPTVTLPNARVVGSEPSGPGAMPSPDNFMVSVGLEPSEVMVKSPSTLPVASGAKVKVKLVLCPEVRVSGAAMPLN